MITRNNLEGGVSSTAVYSDCEHYRYSLKRVWEPKKQKIIFILLNPSTATELRNDPTVERCERRARELGFGSFLVCNIFAWRDTNPKKMKLAIDPIGEHNNKAILEGCHWANRLICAWGAHGSHLNRSDEVLAIMKEIPKTLYHLGLTKHGLPKHPLYISYKQKPLIWKHFNL